MLLFRVLAPFKLLIPPLEVYVLIIRHQLLDLHRATLSVEVHVANP